MQRRSGRGQQLVEVEEKTKDKEKDKNQSKERDKLKESDDKTQSPSSSRRGGRPQKKSEPKVDDHEDVVENTKAKGDDKVQEKEEEVLNARGRPARQRKKNRFYYDEDIMITPDTIAKSKTYGRRIKSEPLDYDAEDDDAFNDYEPEMSPPRIIPPSPPKSVSPKRKRRGTDNFEDLEKSPSPERTHKKNKSPTKTGRGHGKRSKDERKEEKKKKKAKKDEAKASSPSPVELPRKPKMQYIRIKREPDMSLSSPEHVIYATSPPQSGYNREERHSERHKKNYSIIDELMIKQDYNDHNDESRGGYGYDPDYESPAKPSRPEPMSGILDKKTAQDISIRLRNLLKLPKAHKWVCYEWFYSNIDKVLFEGENDFQICLKESFPQLKSRKMTRVEWCKVRRLMGKPRRCSQSFFDEEREELGRRRQKIRMIQQRKVTDFNYKELPDEIPLQLVIGTKVTSRLRKPQDGLFTGTIDGVDTSNNTYRITFDRPGLGTHSIPDYEVLSNEAPETVSTSSFAMKIPRRNYGAFNNANFKFPNPFLMGDDIVGFPKSPFPVDGMLGGFPIRLLDMIVRLSKLLKGKRERILHLKELNVEAEKLRSYGKRLNDDYRLRYARVVVDLESMNKEMGMYLEGIQQYCLEIAPDHGANQMIIPEHVQESCRHEAALLVDTYNTNKSRNIVQGHKNLQLIADMTSLLLQVKALSNGDRNLYELKSIKDTIGEIKASLSGSNVQLFQDRVEIPMNRIQTGLTLSSHK